MRVGRAHEVNLMTVEVEVEELRAKSEDGLKCGRYLTSETEAAPERKAVKGSEHQWRQGEWRQGREVNAAEREAERERKEATTRK